MGNVLTFVKDKFTRAGIILFAMLFASVGLQFAAPLLASAATLSSGSLSLSDSRINQTSQYTFTASGFSTGQTIGCIEIDLGTAANGSGAPAGLSTGSSTFVSQTITASGTWTVDNTQSASQILRITNATPVVPQSGSQSVTFGAVTNGSVAETAYFAKVTTYTTNSCATPSDTQTVNFIYTNGQSVSLSVDPSLTFTVAGTSSGASCNSATSTVTTTASTVPFGTVTASANQVGVQNVTTSTNAGNGYTTYVRYSGQPSNGSHPITDFTGTNASPATFSSFGTEAFGYTTGDTTLGTGTASRFSGNKWAKFTTSDLEVAYSAAAASSDQTCIGYQVGISNTTPSGTYTDTVIFTTTPIY